MLIYVRLSICLNATHCLSLTDVCYHVASASRIRCTAMGWQGKKGTDSVVWDERDELQPKELAQADDIKSWATWRIENPPRNSKQVQIVHDGRPRHMAHQIS